MDIIRFGSKAFAPVTIIDLMVYSFAGFELNISIKRGLTETGIESDLSCASVILAIKTTTIIKKHL
jgi:hypothetical protein